MPVDKETIERAIVAAHDDVDRLLSGLNVRVKAIQFLLPETHQLNEIQRFLYCDRGTHQGYVKAANIFVFGKEEASDKDDVIRSLYYLQFDEPFRYRCYDETLPAFHGPFQCEISQDQFDSSKNPPVPINKEQLEKLKNQLNLDPFWDAWCDTLRKESYGDSTLWTYIQIRKAGTDNMLASGIIVFDGCLGNPKSLEDKSFKLLSLISKRIQEALYDLTLNLFKLEIAHQAARAAISQVMARNMSHNIGSHVSYKATNRAIKSRIAQLYAHKFPNRNADTIRDINRQEFIIDWIDFMSEKLDKYEIQRNEYLADFTLSPQSFRFYQDVILPFCENTLILDNLASAEGANYNTARDNKLKIRVFIKQESDEYFKEIKAEYPALTCDFPGDDCDEQVIYPDHFPYLFRSRSEGVSLADGINSKRPVGAKDVDVLLHSEQGLYSILENFIRNSAKHNKDDVTATPLEIRLYLDELGDRFHLILCDNVSKLEASKLFNSAPESPGLYQRIKTNLIGDGEQSIRQNLGFADMNINSFLFKHRAADVGYDAISSNLHLVKIRGDLCNLAAERIQGDFGDHEPSRKHQFGYLMELLKPRKVLWIGNDITIGEGSKNISDLKNGGIFQYDDLDSYINYGGSGKEEIATFEFVIFYKSFNYGDYLRCQIMLPPRVLVIPDGDLEEYNKPNVRPMVTSFEGIGNPDDLVEMCWEQWLAKLPKRVATYIYYENNEMAAAELDQIKDLKGGHTIESVNNLQQQVVIRNDIIAIIYDHHGNAFTNSNLEYKLGTERSNTKNSITNFYTQHVKIVFDKGSDDYVRLNQMPSDNYKRKLLAYQLIDAATTNVFILDERIASLANDKRANAKDTAVGIKFGKYDSLTFSSFCYGKVFAINYISTDDSEGKPIHSGNFQYRLTLHVKAGSIRVSGEDAANNVLGDINDVSKDVLVVHRTYMKREILGMDVKDFLDLAGRIFGSVVITSGGGYPHSIKEQVRFLPFSLVQQCLGSRLAKLKLVTCLQKLQFVE